MKKIIELHNAKIVNASRVLGVVLLLLGLVLPQMVMADDASKNWSTYVDQSTSGNLNSSAGLTWSSTSSSSSITQNYLQMAANGTLTVSCGAEYEITKVVITTTNRSSYPASRLVANAGSYSASGVTGTWTGTVSTVTFTASSIVRISKFVVTYSKRTQVETLTFALKTSGNINTGKRYLIACQEGPTGKDGKALLMSSAFEGAMTTGTRGAVAAETVDIESNAIRTSAANSFIIEAANDGKYYIRNAVGRYMGSKETLLVDQDKYFITATSAGDDYKNSIVFDSNDGSFNIQGTYTGYQGDDEVYHYHYLNYNTDTEKFCYGGWDKNGGKVYLYEEIDEPIVVEEKFITMTAKDDGYYYATYSSNITVKFREEVTAYIINSKEDASKLNLVPVAENVVPANTGVLLRTKLNTTSSHATKFYAYYTEEASSSASYADNWLHPATGELTSVPGGGDYKYYKLAYRNWTGDVATSTGLGFFYGAANGVAYKAKKGGAFLAIPADLASKITGFSFDEDVADGIVDVDIEVRSAVNAVYNLAGQRVNELVRGQIYIMNGKKFVAQ